MNKWKLVLFIFAVATRFHNLNIPDYVCWDETHFGKMANWYLSRTFFLDVHPPLAKLLIAGVGKIAGLDAREIFHRPGDHFNSTAYVWMRSGSAASGVASIMLAVSTLSSIDQSGIAATVCSVLMLFDCGFILLTKLILVDPYVIVLITAILNSTSGW